MNEYTIQVPDAQARNDLKRYFKSIGIDCTGKGVFFKGADLPAYHRVSDSYSYEGWQCVKGFPNGDPLKVKYDHGIPVHVFINPSLYPEYFI